MKCQSNGLHCYAFFAFVLFTKALKIIIISPVILENALKLLEMFYIFTFSKVTVLFHRRSDH